MPLTVESALITKKSPASEFNTDSINAIGKTWPRETVHSEKGIRAIGTGKDVPYYVLASSPAKGTAESAADLFKSCTEIFEQDMSNCSAVISEFFVSFAKVLNEAGFESSNCDIAVLCGHKSTVYLAKCGNAKMYRYSGGQLSEALPQLFGFPDGKSSYGVCAFRDTAPDDIFIMLNGYVASVLPADLISAIAKSADGDIKKLVSIISFQAEKYGCQGAMSAIVAKVTETEPEEAAVPVPSDDVADKIKAALAAETAQYTEQTGIAEDESTAEKSEIEKISNGKKAILGVSLAVFFVLLAVLSFMATRAVIEKASENTTAPDVTTTEKETTTRSTKETTDESTTAETTTEETTTAAKEPESTSKRRQEPASRQPAVTPSSTEPVSEKNTDESTSSTETTSENVSDNATEESASESQQDTTDTSESSEEAQEPAGGEA